MWCCSRMEKISWTDHVRNEEVLQRVKEERIILHCFENCNKIQQTLKMKMEASCWSLMNQENRQQILCLQGVSFVVSLSTAVVRIFRRTQALNSIQLVLRDTIKGTPVEQ